MQLKRKFNFPFRLSKLVSIEFSFLISLSLSPTLSLSHSQLRTYVRASPCIYYNIICQWRIHKCICVPMALALEHVARYKRRRTLHSSCIESESNRNGIEAIENEK